MEDVNCLRKHSSFHREGHRLLISGTTEAHQEITWDQTKGVKALHTPWPLSVTPPLNHCYKAKSESEVAQWCLTLCDPVDCSLPGSSNHGIFQARILEWVAISFSRRSSLPRNWTQVFHIVGRRFSVWATRTPELEHTVLRAWAHRVPLCLTKQ